MRNNNNNNGNSGNHQGKARSNHQNRQGGSSNSGSLPGLGKLPRHRELEKSKHYSPLTHHEFKKNQGQPQGQGHGHGHGHGASYHKGPSEDLLKKLDRLMDLYMQARKKYFELYNKVEEKQRKHLERELYEHLRNYRRHENFLSKHHAYLLSRKTIFYKQDSEYSSKHPEIQKVEVPEFQEEGEREDIHLLATQKIREKYKNDEEESVGTIDDYYTLKGGRPSL